MSDDQAQEFLAKARNAERLASAYGHNDHLRKSWAAIAESYRDLARRILGGTRSAEDAAKEEADG